MPLKKSKKSSRLSRSSRYPAPHARNYGLTIIILGVLILFVFIKVTNPLGNISQVLGVSTLIAQGGDVGGNTGGGGENGGGPSQIENSGFDQQMPGEDGRRPMMPPPSGTQNNHGTFRLLLPPNRRGESNGQQLQAGQTASDGSGMKFNLQRRGGRGSRVEIQTENGRLVVKEKKEDGTENELSPDDGVRQLDGALSQLAVEVDQASTSGDIILKKGGITARTHLPLSVDPETHVLTVTTPAGSKEVTVLPDQAVNNMLTKGILSRIGDQTGSDSAEVELTEKNNVPVFSMQGVSQQKLFGLVPVDIHKKVDVSAETGNMVNTDESFFQQILDTFSF